MAYIVKLNIELTMADLIAKIARSTAHSVVTRDNEFAVQTVTEPRRPELTWMSKSGKDDVEILQLEHVCYDSR